MKARTSHFMGGLMATTMFTAMSAGAAFAQLDEIIVTAEKREASLQDTALSISAFNEAQIEQLGISDAYDIGAHIPSLTTAKSPSSISAVSFYIRGIGNGEPILTAEQPVGVYVDGAVLARQTGSLLDIIDLERVEVLRGPQGSLYGRNTTGGAINFITKRPGDEQEINQKFSYGNYGYWQSKTSIDTGELGDSGVRTKFTYLHKERDGIVDDINAPKDKDPGSFDIDAFRAALSWQATDNINVDYAFDFSNRQGTAPAFQTVTTNALVGGFLSLSAPVFGGSNHLISPDDRLDEIAFDDDATIHDEVRGHNLNITWESDYLTFKSITSYRDWHNSQMGTDLDGQSDDVFGEYLEFFQVPDGALGMGLDGIPDVAPRIAIRDYNGFSANNVRNQDQWSQEFQVLGNIGERFDFVAGAYYFREEGDEDNPQFFDLILPQPFIEGAFGLPAGLISVLDNPSPFLGGCGGGLNPVVPACAMGMGSTTGLIGFRIGNHLTYSTTGKSWALFGQAKYVPPIMGDRMTLSYGMRYTEDRRAFDQTSAVVRSGKEKFDSFNYDASINMSWTDDFSTYARIATGYKAGGFNPRSGPNNSFDDENLTTYEVGVKSEWFDRRLRINGSVFYNEYDDIQVNQFVAGSGGASSITLNAGESETTGFEVEILAVPVDGLTLNVGLGMFDPDFEEYLVVNPVNDLTYNLAASAAAGGGAETTLNAGVQYDFPPMDVGQLSMRIDYMYESERFHHPITNVGDQLLGASLAMPLLGLNTAREATKSDESNKVNARISLSDIAIADTQATMVIALWGKNILDEETVGWGIDFGGLGFTGVQYDEPATYGIDVSIKY